MFQEIPLTDIIESATNPRTRFDPAKLANLTDSVKRVGVLQPILVRPGKASPFELIAGHRRFRAATAAGLETIPANVRDLDDKQALEAQTIENLEREDLHPMEEAEAYERLCVQHGYTPQTLAEKLSKSPAYIYGRMKLTALCVEARKLFWEDRFNHSVALLIARIPDAKLQAKAAKEIAEYRHHNGDSLSVREAASHIAKDYMLRLQEADWKLDDETLVPAAGSCTKCPLRTGNQLELGGSPTKDDLCTKPACFQSKRDEHWTRTKREAEALGQPILSDKEASKVLQHGHVVWGSGYVSAAETCNDDPRHRTYAKLLGRTMRPFLARSAEGKVFELYPKNDLNKALQLAGHHFKGSAASGGLSASEKEAEEARRVDRAAEKAIVAELMPRLAGLQLNEGTLRLITIPVALSRLSMLEAYFKRHGMELPNWEKKESVVAEHVATLNTGQMLALMFESLLIFSPTEMRNRHEKELPAALCELVDVDWRTIEKGVRDEFEEKKRKRQAKTKKAAASAAPKPAPAGSSKGTAKKAQRSASAALQGRYVGLLRQLPVKKRNKYVRIAKDQGREAAITALEAALQ